MSDESERWPESREFYDAMQRYRHAPMVQPDEVVAAYGAVKALLRAARDGGFIQLCTGCPCHELPLQAVSTIDSLHCAWCGCPVAHRTHPKP